MRIIFILFYFFSFTAFSGEKSLTTKSFLNENEKLVYVGSAPRLSILGKNIGMITITTTKEKLISKKKCFKINLKLELSKGLSGLYKYGAIIRSVLSYDLFTTLVYYKNDIKKHEKRFEKAIIDYDEKLIYYHKYNQIKKGPMIKIPLTAKKVVDPLSLIFYLRTINFKGKKGQTPLFYLFNRGKILKIAIDYAKVNMEISGKKMDVIHIRPSKATRGALIRKRDIELFLDSKTKIPVLIRVIGIPVVGSLELVLTKTMNSNLNK